MRHHHEPRYKSHGITSYTNLTHTLSINHEVPIHTINMSFSMNDQPSIISHAKLITNSFVITHNIHSTCISTPFIHNNSLNQPIKQPSTFIHQSIAKTKLGLAQAGSPRSGERSALAQAADSRLGETATMPLEGFANSRLGEAVSPGQTVRHSKIQPLA